MIKLWVTLALTPVIGWLAGVTQDAAGASGGALDSIIPAIAGTSPFAGLAIWVINNQSKTIGQKDQKIDSVLDQVMEQVIPGVVESNRLHIETVKALEFATVNAHQLAGRSFDPVTQKEILDQLRRLRGPKA